jgi:hypothetical protein
MFDKFQNKTRSFIQSLVRNETQNAKEKVLLSNGEILCRLNKPGYENSKKLSDHEFKIFSQWGEDGIIQYLIQAADIKSDFFIEFGVENYSEANTRFLLMNNNWSGLVIDSSESNIKSIRNNDLYWRYNLIAKAGFVTAENINDMIKEEKVEGEIGILSMDIDGNDYWIWEAINVVQPVIVIVEYNSVFGKDTNITVPYNKEFDRHKQHYSGLYWGASLGAFNHLAEQKGYAFAGSNSAGNNAFFVLKSRLGKINPVTVEEGYVESKFRDSKNLQGQLDFASGKERINKIKGLPVFDVVQKRMINL